MNLDRAQRYIENMPVEDRAAMAEVIAEGLPVAQRKALAYTILSTTVEASEPMPCQLDRMPETLDELEAQIETVKAAWDKNPLAFAHSYYIHLLGWHDCLKSVRRLQGGQE